MKLLINDKEYGLQWGMGAIELYCDAMDCDVDGLDMVTTVGRNQNRAIVTLILASIQNYSELNGTIFDITYRQLQAWLDEAPQETFKSIMEDFKASKYLGKTVAEYIFGTIPQDAPVKKKSGSRKSLVSAMK